jgi:hypothetical protein
MVIYVSYPLELRTRIVWTVLTATTDHDRDPPVCPAMAKSETLKRDCLKDARSA